MMHVFVGRKTKQNGKTHNQTHKIYTQNMDTDAHKHTQGDYGAALLL